MPDRIRQPLAKNRAAGTCSTRDRRPAPRCSSTRPLARQRRSATQVGRLHGAGGNSQASHAMGPGPMSMPVNPVSLHLRTEILLCRRKAPILVASPPLCCSAAVRAGRHGGARCAHSRGARHAPVHGPAASHTDCGRTPHRFSAPCRRSRLVSRSHSSSLPAEGLRTRWLAIAPTACG